jgi:beta-glucuronidase
MRQLSRRDLITQIGVGGASLALAQSASGAPQSGLRPEASGLVTEVIPLDGEWQFKLDPDGAGESRNWHLASREVADWRKVSVPHTWQVSPASVEYQGVAWYRRTFEAPAQWAEKTVRVEFEAVYHSATVWLNDQLVGKHLRSGYTAFTLDVSSALRPGSANTLVVKVDNSFDDQLLPRGKSFDWTVDGGITRPVSLLISPPTFIERVKVDVDPNLDTNQARLAVQVVLRNAAGSAAEAKVGFAIAEDDTGRTVLRSETATRVLLEPRSSRAVSLPVAVLASPRLWHFDHPHLYRVGVEIEREGKPLHSCADTFGIRNFEVKDVEFYLNGERVHLMGVERMAGSHPDYGMAEPSSWITHDHNDLKELNCVFTRVHWQQDRRVLDYCDRHGILIQEEVPAWGPDTFKGMSDQPSPELLENGLAQLREMIQRDSNHPSIFAWGLCNEVDGQNPPARAFIQRMAEEAKRLDPHRLLTYASHSLYQNPGNDIAGLLDFISFNEYYESWRAGNPETLRGNLQQIHAAFPNKPLVISEYGYCECTPDRRGGDARRIEILRDHTDVFRELGFVTGAIFFDYNDYRTHVGDKGIGALKQRVHGVVDLYGNRKPSFDALRDETSPFEELQVTITGRWITASLQVRDTLPAYTLEGYTLRCIVYGFGDLPVEQLFVPLPRLKPGEGIIQEVDFQEKAPKRVRVDIMRPTGFSAKTAWWRGNPESAKG